MSIESVPPFRKTDTVKATNPKSPPGFKLPSDISEQAVATTTPPLPSWSPNQDIALRHSLLHTDDTHRKTPLSNLQNALHHYNASQQAPPSATPKSTFERIAAIFLRPAEDPIVTHLNDLHTLYAVAIRVCGDSLRQLVSESEIQGAVEHAWKTGEVDPHHLAFLETAVVGAVTLALDQDTHAQYPKNKSPNPFDKGA